jgi:hypothetical protein
MRRRFSLAGGQALRRLAVVGHQRVLAALAANDRSSRRRHQLGRASIRERRDPHRHSMTWLGITGVRALDGLVNEVPLPSDAYPPLFGRAGGCDDWHSAALASVPESAPMLFLRSA